MTYLKTLAAAGGDLLRAALAPLYARPEGERGARLPADLAMARFYRQFSISTEVRDQVIALRQMEEADGRVRRIHARLGLDIIRGGLEMQFTEADSSETLRREWKDFAHRLQLTHAGKLRSDARGLVAEGNLPLQVVLDDSRRVAAAVRMPAETMVPLVDSNGRFADVAKAWEQRNTLTGQPVASFAAWQLHMGRHDPLSWDDMGSMGRPVLAGLVAQWRKLRMTEDDLVLRRRQRAPLRLSHVLEGATPEELDAYRKTVEGEKGEIANDFYSNRRGAVTAVQGDATLSEIADVVHLMDGFFAGTPMPKSLLGYVDGLARDVWADQMAFYFQDIDHLQDLQAATYEGVFRVHLLLKGIVVGPDELRLRFAERRTETANEVADLALKLLAAGLPPPMVWEAMGYDPAAVQEAVENWGEQTDPYPPGSGVPPAALDDAQDLPPGAQPGAARVSITPGNARRTAGNRNGGSATSIGVAGTNHGRGRG